MNYNYLTGLSRIHFDEAAAGAGAAGAAGDAGKAAAAAAGAGDAGAAGDAGKGADGGTIIGDKGGAGDADAGKQLAPADWPTDWRDKVAAQVKPGDAKFRERLERLASPIDVTKSWLAAEQKISSGELRQPFPKDGKPEAIAAWRKDNGVPEKPENYSTELPGGAKFDESDQSTLTAYLQAAHAYNWTQDQVTQGLSNLHTAQREQADRLAAFDTEHKQKGEDTLRSEWGTDYRRNVNAVDNLVATMPADLAETFINGRLSDGTKIGADPRIIRWLSSLAADYPSLVSDGGDIANSQESRMSELRELIKDRRSAYYKGADANKLQTEYRNLLDVENRRKSRAA